MSRRDEWRRVLAAEFALWTAKSSEQLLSKLRDPPLAYQIEVDSKMYNVEVVLLENTEQYLHVLVSLDDGSLPASIVPVSQSFIREKATASPLKAALGTGGRAAPGSAGREPAEPAS